jgi:hypothetical protein
LLKSIYPTKTVDPQRRMVEHDWTKKVEPRITRVAGMTTVTTVTTMTTVTTATTMKTMKTMTRCGEVSARCWT